jgi:hypothetical protein
MTTTTKIAGEAMTELEQESLEWLDKLCAPDMYGDRLGAVRDWVKCALLASKPAVPEGWKLAMVERSYDMRVKAIIAFNTAEQSGKDRDDALDAAWQAMLAASPTAPAQPCGEDAAEQADEAVTLPKPGTTEYGSWINQARKEVDQKLAYHREPFKYLCQFEQELRKVAARAKDSK